MTEWTLLKRLLDSVHQHSTMIGRLWLTVMAVFRLLVVAVATDDVYADEQEMFACNTRQPGCPTVCYDAFAPISQPRFWVFHIVSVSTPALCFIVYTWHRLAKWPRAAGAAPQVWGRAGGRLREAYDRSCDSDSCSIRAHKHLGHSLADVLEGVADRSPQGKGLGEGGAPGNGVCREEEGEGVLSKCYVVHVCLRAVLEAGFLAAQWALFGFRVPVRFLCTAAPCGQPVDCYVSRPTEKTVFLLFMFAVGALCVLLSLLELGHLGRKKLRRVVGLGRGYETFAPPDDSTCLTSPSPASSLGCGDTSTLPTLDLVVGHRPDWTCQSGDAGGCVGPRLPCGRLDPRRGEEPPLRSKQGSGASKQRGAEVWI